MGYGATPPPLPLPQRQWRPRATALLLATGLCAAAALLSTGTLLPSAPAIKEAKETWQKVPLVEAAGHPKPQSKHALNVALVHARSKVERYEEGIKGGEERAAKHGGDDAKGARRLKFERKELAKFTHLEESLVAERQEQLSQSVKAVAEEPKKADGNAAADSPTDKGAEPNKTSEVVATDKPASPAAESIDLVHMRSKVMHYEDGLAEAEEAQRRSGGDPAKARRNVEKLQAELAQMEKEAGEPVKINRTIKAELEKANQAAVEPKKIDKVAAEPKKTDTAAAKPKKTDTAAAEPKKTEAVVEPKKVDKAVVEPKKPVTKLTAVIVPNLGTIMVNRSVSRYDPIFMGEQPLTDEQRNSGPLLGKGGALRQLFPGAAAAKYGAILGNKRFETLHDVSSATVKLLEGIGFTAADAKSLWETATTGKINTNAFEVPKNHNLLIDIDPSKTPDIWKGADWDGIGCHKFSINDNGKFLGDTQTLAHTHNQVDIKKAYPGSDHKMMMAFKAKYCDIPRGSHGGNGKDGSACYRSEWTIDPKCRDKYIQHEGEFWFGFSMYIPETVAKGMEADSVADGIFKTQEPERAKQMKSAMYAKLEKDGAKLKETEDQTDWVFQTAERNWLDLFQIHHGGDSQPVKHMEREPILALTLMDGHYYTLMVAGATPEGDMTTTIERVADVKAGTWENFVYHTVLSSSKEKGLAELWRGGEKLFEKKGFATQYHTDNNVPFPKFGAYADTWKFKRAAYNFDTLEVGYGEFKMAGAGASYNDVCIGSCETHQTVVKNLAVAPTPLNVEPSVTSNVGHLKQAVASAAREAVDALEIAAQSHEGVSAKETKKIDRVEHLLHLLGSGKKATVETSGEQTKKTAKDEAKEAIQLAEEATQLIDEAKKRTKWFVEEGKHAERAKRESKLTEDALEKAEQAKQLMEEAKHGDHDKKATGAKTAHRVYTAEAEEPKKKAAEETKKAAKTKEKSGSGEVKGGEEEEEEEEELALTSKSWAAQDWATTKFELSDSSKLRQIHGVSELGCLEAGCFTSCQEGSICVNDAEKLRQSKCVTVTGHTDGLGSTYDAIISGLIAAAKLGISFRHTAPTRIWHMGAGTEESAHNPEQIAAADYFFGLKADKNAGECEQRHHFVHSGFGSIFDPPQASADTYVKLIRSMYFEHSKKEYEPTDFGPDYYHGKRNRNVNNGQPFTCTAENCDIAVHIRRGDVATNKGGLANHDSSRAPRHVSDEQYLWVLEKVLAEINGMPAPTRGAPQKSDPDNIEVENNCRNIGANFCEPVEAGDSIETMQSTPIRFHIYSEGREKGFAQYTKWAKRNGVGLRLHLNGDPKFAFHAMVMADVLVHGPSRLADLAAHYSIGKQYALNPSMKGLVTVLDMRLQDVQDIVGV